MKRVAGRRMRTKEFCGGDILAQGVCEVPSQSGGSIKMSSRAWSMNMERRRLKRSSTLCINVESLREEWFGGHQSTTMGGRMYVVETSQGEGEVRWGWDGVYFIASRRKGQWAATTLRNSSK